MPRATSAWKIPSSGDPLELPEGMITAEASLEEWIIKSPAMLEPGLEILAQQLEIGSGRLDLLCLDDDNRLVVIELKKSEMYRNTLAQVLDYASWIHTITPDEFENNVNENRKLKKFSKTLSEILEERLGSHEMADEWAHNSYEPRVIVAGTGGDASLQRIIEYLANQYSVPINAIFFDVYKVQHELIIVRSLAITEDTYIERKRKGMVPGMTDDPLFMIARNNNVETSVKNIIEVWTSSTGKKPRPLAGQKCWQLQRKSDGRAVVGRLYPWDDDGRIGIAWVQIDLDALIADLSSVDISAMETFFNENGVEIKKDPQGLNWICVSSEEVGQKLGLLLEKLYKESSS